MWIQKNTFSYKYVGQGKKKKDTGRLRGLLKCFKL